MALHDIFLADMMGHYLQAIRKSARLSQAGWGKLVGANRVTVSNWETGKTEVPATVEVIALIVQEHPELLPKIERWRGMRK